MLAVLSYDTVKTGHSEIILAEGLIGLLMDETFTIHIKCRAIWEGILGHQSYIRVDLIEIIIDSGSSG